MLLCSLLFLVNISIAQVKDSASLSFSLQQCVDYATKNQNKILNAGLDEQLAAAKVKEVVGIGLPQINGSFDLKDYLSIPTSLLPAQVFGGRPGDFIPVKFGTKYNASAGFDASQILFDGTYIVGLQAAKTYLELSKKNAERTKIETVVAVNKAYYGALINEERFNLLKTNVARIKKLLDDTKAMYESGFVEKIDVSRITVNYNNLMVERLLKMNYVLLKFQMGMDLKTKLILTDKLNSAAQAAPLATEKIDYSKRVEYSLIQSQQHLYELDLKKNKMGYLPSVIAYGSLIANAQRNTFDIFDTDKKWYPIAIIGGRITVPIFDGLQKNYRIQQAKINLLKSRNDAKTLEQSIDLEVSSTQINYQNNLASLETQKKNIVLAEEVYNTSKIKYDQGVGSNLEIINADASLKEAQTNYYNAMYDVLVSKIDLDKANGLIK
jgi:outer membrane protein